MSHDQIITLKEWGADTDGAIKRMLDDEAFYLELIDAFMTNKDWEQLCQLISAKKYREAFVVSHRIKGSCADLSLTPLYKVMCELTDDLRGEVRPTLEENFKEASLLREALMLALE